MSRGVTHPSALARFDVGRAADLRPLFRFIGDELPEVRRRTSKRRGTEVGQARLNAWICECRAYDGVELLDDVNRCILRRDYPVQPLASNPGTNSPTAGTSGSAGARVAVVTAKPRSTGIARQLKVGMAPVLSRRVLLRAIPAFQERYPAIQLILLRIYESAEIGDEGIDVLIRPGSTRQSGVEHRQPQGLVVRKLAQSPTVLCASPGYLKRAGVPRVPTDLARRACLALLTLE